MVRKLAETKTECAFKMGRGFARIFIPMLVVASIPKMSFATTTLLEPQIMSFLQEAASGKWFNGRNQGIAAFICCTGSDPETLLREFSSRVSSVRISTPKLWFKTLSKIVSAGPKETLNYVVDLSCPGVENLLYKAGKVRRLKIPNRWLLLNVTSQPNITDNAIAPVPLSDFEDGAPCRDLAETLVQSDGFGGRIPTDSDITLVCRTPGNKFALVDLWARTPLGFWSPENDIGYRGDRRPPSARRYAVGLNGREFRAAFLITKNDTWEHMDDGINIHYDTFTKFNWEVINNVVKMLNASMVTLSSNTFGYNINGSWTGIIGMQIRGEAEMSGTSLAVVSNRFSLITYSNFPIPARGMFIFRAPPMSYEHNLFTQPFPSSLWVAAIGIICLCAIMLYGVLKIEEIVEIEENHTKHTTNGIPWNMISEGRKRRLMASWSDVALLAFGAVCQQGSPVEARGLTGRIITLFLFIGILFLYTSYCASIVALLQSTSTSIRTYQDLLNSKIKIGAESTDYNMYYLKNLRDPSRRRLYEKKMKKNFMPLDEGIRRVRKSYFAFHTVRSIIYTEIAETFQENEKCGLHEIDSILSLQDPQMAVSNWSEHTELVMQALRKQHERGIRNRQISRFLTPKPRCMNQGANFQSVALIDCEAAFIVLVMGVGVGSLLLFMEKLMFRYQKALRILYDKALRRTNDMPED